VWVVRRGNDATIVLTNFALPRHQLETRVVRVVLRNAEAPIKATIQRIDEHHGNAKRHWQQLGEPEYLDARMISQLHVASRMHHDVQAFRHASDLLELDVVVPPYGIAAVALQFATAAA
jgi:xylan 1,4-beta-xylosidase